MSLTSSPHPAITKLRFTPHIGNVASAIGIFLFCLNSFIFIVLGQLNADEGWYLYASKLVYSWQLPYRDFAFTQTPLLPFIYGTAQNFLFQSLYLGRITSMIFSCLAFFLLIKIARIYGGPVAGGIASLLGGSFTYGIYFQSITKTYALTTFFFILTVFVFSSHWKQGLKFVWLSIILFLATLTRLSSLFFAIPFLTNAFTRSGTREKLTGTAISLILIFPALALALQNIDATFWGLFGHHTSAWNQVDLLEWTTSRLPALMAWTAREFFGYVLLWGVILLLGFRRTWKFIQGRSPISFTIAAIILFMIPNFISDGFQPEYFVPILFVSFPILAILYRDILPSLGLYRKILLYSTILFTFLAGEIQGLKSYIDLSGGQAPIEEIRQVANLIKENSDPNDKIFVMEALWLAIESHRPVVPNTEMAQFSFYDIDTGTARHLHLLNSEMVWNVFETGEPKIIILTDLDEDMLIDSTHHDEIFSALDRNYDRLYRVKENFGQRKEGVKIYIRCDDK